MKNSQARKVFFSWRATLIGGLLAFGLLFLFNLLAVGMGLASYARIERGAETLVAFAYLWTTLGSFFILFIAGMVASMLAYYDCNVDEHHFLLHGFITWVFYLLISLAFLSNIKEVFTVIFPEKFFTFSEKVTNSNVESPLNNRFAISAKNENAMNRNVHQKEARKLGVATLASFFIFVIEALGACFGAWCGMDICRRRYSTKQLI